MEDRGYPRALSEHLEERAYRPETVQFIGRACRVGRISEETALDFLEALEADRVLRDAELLQTPIVTGTAGSLEWEH